MSRTHCIEKRKNTNKKGLSPLITLKIICTTGEYRMKILMNSKVLITEKKITTTNISLLEKLKGFVLICKMALNTDSQMKA